MASQIKKLKKRLLYMNQILYLNDESRLSLERLNVGTKRLVHVPTFSQEGFSGISKEKAVIFLGRLSTEKGIEFLIHCWENSNMANEGWTLRIAGDGELSTKIRDLSDKSSSINFLGKLDRLEIREWIKTSFAVVVPSLGSEGFPKVIAEGAEAGCQILTTFKFWREDSEAPTWAHIFNPVPRDLTLVLENLKFETEPSKEAQAWWELNCSNAAMRRFIENKYGIC